MNPQRNNEMTQKRLAPHITPRRSAVEILLILALSFAAQGTQFSYKQGRALISGDSAQYVASAEALVNGETSPHFEMRKPGYTFYLAAIFLVFGNMGWASVAGNHVFLGLLPLAAYGWGCHLHSRSAGWVAAFLVLARLPEVIWGDRMMSEALFTCLFSFGSLALAVGLSRPRPTFWMLTAGVMLGLSWLTRGSATPTIALSALAILIVMRKNGRCALSSVAWFAAPIACCIALECGLNLTYAGQFRPANGTVGATLLLRARHFEGFDLPATPDAERVNALLPQRGPKAAYAASHLDIWVARYHAIHNQGMSEWEYDKLMGRVGWATLRANLPQYLASSVRLTLAHLFRRHDGQVLSRVPDEARAGHLIHPAAKSIQNWDATWFAYYGLPHLTPDDSVSLVHRMQAAADQRAPIGGSNAWKALRYWRAIPSAEWIRVGLAQWASIWPGFALLGTWFLGFNRRTCAFLAAAYVLDAVFLGFMTPTNFRLQFIWFVTDTVLTSCLVVGCLHWVAKRNLVSHYLARFFDDRSRPLYER
jgi:hypothetical protein